MLVTAKGWHIFSQTAIEYDLTHILTHCTSVTALSQACVLQSARAEYSDSHSKGTTPSEQINSSRVGDDTPPPGSAALASPRPVSHDEHVTPMARRAPISVAASASAGLEHAHPEAHESGDEMPSPMSMAGLASLNFLPGWDRTTDERMDDTMDGDENVDPMYKARCPSICIGVLGLDGRSFRLIAHGALRRWCDSLEKRRCALWLE
jgi:hypothetical protein